METPSKLLCIICSQKAAESDSHLVSPVSYKSWQTLLNAAKIRNHSLIIDAANGLGEREFPKIYYHRQCRSVFTMKRDLATTLSKRKPEEGISNETGECSSKRVCRRVSESRVYSPVCIFCDKIKYLKSTKSREKLTKAVQLRADKTLRECAIKKKRRKDLNSN